MSQDNELWTNKDSGNKYLIPKGLPFEVGDYALESSTGEQISVKEDQVYKLQLIK